MKRDYFNSFEEKDFDVCADMELDTELSGILVLLSQNFNADRKFGINTRNIGKVVWVNVSAKYNPATGYIRMFYDINDDNCSQSREYIMTDGERNTMTQYIEKMCIENHEMTSMEFYITKYIKICDCEINLKCRQEGDVCFVYNTNDGTVLYQEDMGGKLSEHIGHKIELVNSENGERFRIECMDCNEVLFSNDAERIKVQNIMNNESQKPDDAFTESEQSAEINLI